MHTHTRTIDLELHQHSVVKVGSNEIQWQNIESDTSALREKSWICSGGSGVGYKNHVKIDGFLKIVCTALCCLYAREILLVC